MLHAFRVHYTIHVYTISVNCTFKGATTIVAPSVGGVESVVVDEGSGDLASAGWGLLPTREHAALP